MVITRFLQPILEPHFHADSYGYRPKKSAKDALGVARQRCWRYDWVLDLDIKAFFGAPETVRRQIVKVYHSVRSSDPHCPRVMRGYP